MRRAGAGSLVEKNVVDALKLNDEQRTALAKVDAERREQLGRASGQEREILRNAFEQRTFAILTPEQRTKWDQLAGVVSMTAATVDRAGDAPAGDAGRTSRCRNAASCADLGDDG